MCVRNALSSLLPYGLTGVRKCRFHGGMETPRYPRCGGEMKKNGKTSAGRTRWRCKVYFVKSVFCFEVVLRWCRFLGLFGGKGVH